MPDNNTGLNVDSETPHNGQQNEPPGGGLGESTPDPGIGKKIAIGMDHRAIANGWLKKASGSGLDAEKMGALINRNYDEAMATSDLRALAGLTRNVIAAVGQVMEEEKREAGGENLNVNLGGKVEITDEERVRRLRGLAQRIRRRRLGAADANGTG